MMHLFMAGLVVAMGLLLVLPSLLLSAQWQRMLYGWVALLSLALLALWIWAAVTPEAADEMREGYERAVRYAVLELVSMGFVLSVLLAWAGRWMTGRGR